MASIKKTPLQQFVFFASTLALAATISGCTEVRTIFSVLWNGSTSLSTSAFEVDEMRSGEAVTCSILADKTLRCLGSGAKGELGRFYGAPISALKDVKQLATGKKFSCAILGEKGALVCFGLNDKGQLGNPNYVASVDPVPVLDSENGALPIFDAKSVTAGDNHACAILKTGRAICWGDNSFGQAGNPSEKGVGVKTVMEIEKNTRPMQAIHEIFAGANSTCVIAKDDQVAYCFGERYGNTNKINWIPTPIEMAGSIGSLTQVKSIGLGNGFGCALSRSSQVYCWGRNDMNQLGSLQNSTGNPKAGAVQVSYPEQAGISKVDILAVGENHACALHREEKTVYCWGDNRYGQLGNTSIRGNPEQVALGSNNLTLKGVSQLAVGPDRTCIISERDEVFCWGNGAHGLLGSEKVSSPYPVRVLDANGEMLTGAVNIHIGYDHSCITDSAQKVYCFGLNQFGQMGTKNIAGQVVTGNLKPITRVTSIDTFGLKTCMVYGEQQGVACFGDKDIDIINQKYEVNSFAPEEVHKGPVSYSGALGVSVGRSHICVITADQQVECLGDGLHGQLGSGQAQTAKQSIVQDDKQQPLKDVWQLHSRDEWTCALKQESGSIWCWGQWNNDRWLSAKQITVQGKPTADFIQFSVSDDRICGIKGVERAVFCTDPAEKQADHLDLTPMTDTDGHALKKVTLVSGGKHHTCALDDEGHVFCWGQNDFGQLGSRTLKDSVRAVRVVFKKEVLKHVSRLSTGDQHTCVTTPDEASLYCFGQNIFGGANNPDPIEYPL